MKTRTWLLAAGLTLAPLQPLGAQTRFLTTPPAAVPDEVVEILQAYRYQLLDYLGLPRETGSEEMRFRWLLDAGGLYDIDLAIDPGDVVVLGVCDGDCEDLDLGVYTAESEQLIGKDDKDDAFPVVQFSTAEPARFFIRVGMAKCSVDPCYFEVTVLTSEGESLTP